MELLKIVVREKKRPGLIPPEYEADFYWKGAVAPVGTVGPCKTQQELAGEVGQKFTLAMAELGSGGDAKKVFK